MLCLVLSKCTFMISFHCVGFQLLIMSGDKEQSCNLLNIIIKTMRHRVASISDALNPPECELTKKACSFIQRAVKSIIPTLLSEVLVRTSEISGKLLKISQTNKLKVFFHIFPGVHMCKKHIFPTMLLPPLSAEPQ